MKERTIQANNSRLDEDENQTNDLEHKEAKNNQSEQQEEKIIQKHEESIAASGTTSRGPTFASEEKSKKLEIYLKK